MGRPFVFINVAMTTDGKIDTFQRKGAAISSQRDKQRVDQLRAESDAVMVGGETLIEEDPKLTVKSDALREERVKRGLTPNPIKVGVVSKVESNSLSKFLHEGGGMVVIFTTIRTSKDQLESLRSHDLKDRVEVFVHEGERVDLKHMMHTLHEIGIKRLMVEGGARLNFELLRLGLVDEVSAFVAPMIFGGEKAPTLAQELKENNVTANIIQVKAIDVENKGTGTTPDEIVSAIQYLSSEQAGKVNGAKIPLY